MRFPSITTYHDAIANVSERLRTISDVQPILDKNGEPLFYSTKGVVTYVVNFQGNVCALRCFTSVKGFEKTTLLFEAGIITGLMFEDELLAYNDDSTGDYYTIFIDDKSQIARTSQVDAVEFWEGLKPFCIDGLWGYVDPKEETVIKPQYSSVTEMSEGRAVVELNGMYGLINREGDTVLGVEFDEISWDGSALAYVDRGGKWGCYDRQGNQIIECRYDWMGEFVEGLLLVKLGEKFGFLNLLGGQAIPFVLDKATSFDDNGLTIATIDGHKVVLNRQGGVEV